MIVRFARESDNLAPQLVQIVTPGDLLMVRGSVVENAVFAQVRGLLDACCGFEMLPRAPSDDACQANTSFVLIECSSVIHCKRSGPPSTASAGAAGIPSLVRKLLTEPSSEADLLGHLAPSPCIAW